MNSFTQLIELGIFIFFLVGIISGIILLVDRFFLIRRHPFLAGSCMYDLLLQDTTYKLELSTIRRKKAKEILMLKYSINNKNDAKQFLLSFFESNKTKDYSIILDCINSNESIDEKTHNILKRYNSVKNISINEYRFTKRDFDNITTISAYKYANIGYVIKLCYKSKYISEKNTIKYLKKLHRYIENEYDSWLEYAISFIVGKIVNSKNFEDELLFILDYLVFDDRSMWNKTNIHLDSERPFKNLEY